MKNKILLTRPAAQNASLQAKLAELGFATLHFPLLSIEKISVAPASQDADLLIFTSQHAVQFYAGEIKVPILAVGSGTQAALAKKNILAKVPEPFSSEGLLSLPELHNVKNKKIAIIGGENPRLVLSETLQKRGAMIETIFCYRRLRPFYSSVQITQIVQHRQLTILVTSAQSLANLVVLFLAHSAWLYRQQLLVTSAGLSQQAIELGFSIKPIVAQNASDEAVLAACQFL